MTPNEPRSTPDELLRAVAEARVAKAALKEFPALPVEEALHELQVHEIELEIQNEALRQSQMALAESRDRYADLYDFAPVGYLTLNADGMVEDINRTGAALLGNRYKKLLKARFTALVATEDQDRWTQHVLSMKQGQGQNSINVSLRRGDGTVFQAKLDCALAQGSFALRAGASTVMRVVMSDITALMEAERTVRNERKRIKTILDVAGDPIFVKDNEHRVIHANRAFCELFGMDESDVIGKTLAEDVPAAERTQFLAVDRQVLDTGQPDVREESLTVNRVERTIVTRKTRFEEDSGERFLVGVIFDITERTLAAKKHALLEAQLRESQKMEAIGTLAGGIAHDFNNIIAAILGNAELARQDAASNPRALESVEEIRKAASRARALVQQILSFSRRQPTERSVIHLSAVVDESVALLRATLPPRITLEVKCDADLPAVFADATQMEQVLINLVTNAVQAMEPEPGRVVIRLDSINAQSLLVQDQTGTMDIRNKWPAGAVRLTVEDDGPGMAAELLGRVFEPFFTTKPVGKGTGLGLSVAHGIVQSHGGMMQLRSQPGVGSAFTVLLPAVDAQTGAPAAELDQQAPAPPTATKAGLHILYIDDDEALVQLTTKLLRKRGIRVTGYTNQQEALSVLRADPAAFDLVLTDYNMPGMSGLDVAREVKAVKPDLPVAVTSGFIDEKLSAQAQGVGVRELIFKADDVEVVCDAVLKAWQRLP